MPDTSGAIRLLGEFFKYSIHELFPSVDQLAVHLLNGQRVYFTDENVQFVARSDPPKTTLTAFFQLLYVDLPRFYTWHASSKTWKRRKRGEKIEGHDIHEPERIGRVYTVSPRQGECFFSRFYYIQ